MRDERDIAGLKILIDNNRDAMWLVDTDLRLRAFNRSFAVRFARLYGIRASVGLSILDVLSRGERTLWRDRYERAIRGETFSLDARYVIGGREWYFELFISPFPGEDGSVGGISVVAVSLKKKYLSEVRTNRLATRLQALLESAVSLNSSIREPTVVYRETMELLAETIQFDTGTVQLLEEDHLSVVETWGFPETDRVVGLQFPLDARFPNQTVVFERRALAVDDIRENYPHFLTEEGKFESGHVRSWLGLPLIVDGQVMGMFTMDRITVDPFSSEDVQVGTALAHNAAVAINNTRLYRELVNANERQEILLRELHHRVKNNMQLVSSLLSLRAEGLAGDAQEVLQSLRIRILSLSAVHEALYQSDQLDRVDLVDYTHQIVREIDAAYSSGNAEIGFHVTGDPALDCSLDRAIPFGLILGELVLNSVKHAFEGRRKGTVTVELQMCPSESATALLRVSDDGVGFSETDHDNRPHRDDASPSGKSVSFGMTLVENLCRQLGGSLVRDETAPIGVSWVLRFPTGHKIRGEPEVG